MGRIFYNLFAVSHFLQYTGIYNLILIKLIYEYFIINYPTDAITSSNVQYLDTDTNTKIDVSDGKIIIGAMPISISSGTLSMAPIIITATEVDSNNNITSVVFAPLKIGSNGQLAIWTNSTINIRVLYYYLD